MNNIKITSTILASVFIFSSTTYESYASEPSTEFFKPGGSYKCMPHTYKAWPPGWKINLVGKTQVEIERNGKPNVLFTWVENAKGELYKTEKDCRLELNHKDRSIRYDGEGSSRCNLDWNTKSDASLTEDTSKWVNPVGKTVYGIKVKNCQVN